MKTDEVRRNADLRKAYRAAASAIAHHTTNPSRLPWSEHEYLPLENLLRSQAAVLKAMCFPAAGVSQHVDQIQEDDLPTINNESNSASVGLEDRQRIERKRLLEEVGQPRKVARLRTPPRSDCNEDQRERGEGCLDLLFHRIRGVADHAYSKFYTYRFDQVPAYWRCIYTDAVILQSYYHLLRLLDEPAEDADEKLLDLAIVTLDRALITTNGQSASLDGTKWIKEVMEIWHALFQPQDRAITSERVFSNQVPHASPSIKKPGDRITPPVWSLEKFEAFMMDDREPPVPIVIPHLLQDWPALNDRPWSSIDYLLSNTLGGRRLVPIEVGRSYTDENWGQEIIPFRQFLNEYILNTSEKGTGYLAQYELFEQIPRLRNDILIPEYCWAETRGHPLDDSKNRPKLDIPNINAWFGPANTITPLHTDGYHNLLCQVVGQKYVRLYSPDCTEALCPRQEEDGVDMSNTSKIDIGVMEGWDVPGKWECENHDGVPEMAEVAGLDYTEYILRPGEVLLIPMGWWHYVRSLSVSFSVSFWWN